ncbi:hypothetical protein ScPMuIL_006654 [Solemya velum]
MDAVKLVGSTAEFNELMKEAGDKLVIVDFYATWCGPCKMISPKLEALAKEHSGQIVVLKVDVDDQEELSSQNMIQAMPTFIFFKNGSKLETLKGANEAKLKELIINTNRHDYGYSITNHIFKQESGKFDFQHCNKFLYFFVNMNDDHYCL